MVDKSSGYLTPHLYPCMYRYSNRVAVVRCQDSVAVCGHCPPQWYMYILSTHPGATPISARDAVALDEPTVLMDGGLEERQWSACGEDGQLQASGLAECLGYSNSWLIPLSAWSVQALEGGGRITLPCSTFLDDVWVYRDGSCHAAPLLCYKSFWSLSAATGHQSLPERFTRISLRGRNSSPIWRQKGFRQTSRWTGWQMLVFIGSQWSKERGTSGKNHVWSSLSVS